MPTKCMKLIGVIFDVDGVLVDSARPHFESWKRLGHEIGRDVTDGAFLETFGRQNKDVIAVLFDQHDPDTVVRYGNRKEAIYREIIRGVVPAMDGAVELVRALHAVGCKLAVGSSGPPENVDLVVEQMNIADCFDALITAREVTRGKPDPQVFQLAAKALGLPPARCAVIEDAPAGIAAANAAGAKSVALTGSHPTETLGAADLIVNSLRELSVERLTSLVDA
jgi:beta-phosphoglucomutase